jgi:hypothetical protein
MRPGIPGAPEAKMKLVEALQMFNRKERYWLIRNALGKTSEELDPNFRKLLKDELSIEVPEKPEIVWWAMDYHLDWLVGALHLYKYQGEETSVARQENPKLFKDNEEKDVYLVNGSIEDIDLIIAFDKPKTLIFIEAKGDAAWDCNQLNRKIGRLKNIAERIKGVESHFILISPKPPQKNRMRNIDATKLDWIFDEEDKPRWRPLQIEDEHNPKIKGFEDFYRVELCRGDKISSGPKTHFCVKKR